jgi:phenylalanyl-tRNA synthetase beta chain
MLGDGKKIVQIANPMTENYEFVRDSVLASLLASESQSAHAAYPHKIFETGKVVIKSVDENYGVATRQYLGALHVDTSGQNAANFNTMAAELQTLFYYLKRDYEVRESRDARFIPGRAAQIIYRGKDGDEKNVGVFGEVHPQVLENWGISAPCAACEIDLDSLL